MDMVMVCLVLHASRLRGCVGDSSAIELFEVVGVVEDKLA